MDIGAIQYCGWDIGALQYVQQGGGTNYEVTLSLDRSVSISPSSTAAQAGVSVDKNLQMDLIAQAVTLAALNTGYSVVIEASATDSTMVIVTPASRTIKIRFENREIKIAYENRTIKIK